MWRPNEQVTSNHSDDSHRLVWIPRVGSGAHGVLPRLLRHVQGPICSANQSVAISRVFGVDGDPEADGDAN
jgi:hypothetical protein